MKKRPTPTNGKPSAVHTRHAIPAPRLDQQAGDEFGTPPERIAALLALLSSVPGNATQQQAERLLAAMRQLGSVTTFEASRYLDIYHPPARKLALIHQGHEVEMVWARVPTESGTLHRIGRYFLRRLS